MMPMVLMVLTTYIPMAYHGLHPVDLGHLSGTTDETCRRGQIPSTFGKSFSQDVGNLFALWDAR